MSKEQVELFRHMRPFNPNTNQVEPKGGITFFFHINQVLSKLTVTWAICHPDDNFDRKRGMQVAQGRFKKFYNSDYITDHILVMDYDRNLPLVDNVLEYLVSDLFEHRNEFHVNQIWSQELQTLFRTMCKINDQLELPW